MSKDKMHAFEVVRGFWVDSKDGPVKICKGEGVELTAEEAMEKLEAGIVKKMAAPSEGETA